MGGLGCRARSRKSWSGLWRSTIGIGALEAVARLVRIESWRQVSENKFLASFAVRGR